MNAHAFVGVVSTLVMSAWIFMPASSNANNSESDVRSIAYSHKFYKGTNCPSSRYVTTLKSEYIRTLPLSNTLDRKWATENFEQSFMKYCNIVGQKGE